MRGLLRGVRFRLTAVAAVIVAVAVGVGLLGLYGLQVSSGRRAVDTRLRDYALQIEQAASGGRWPRPLPVSVSDENAVAQVLDASGRVVAASRTLQGAPALYAVDPGTTTARRLPAADGLLSTDMRTSVVPTTGTGGAAVIVTATSTALLSTIDAELLNHLLLALPVVLVLAVLAIWLVVGRALTPVERIRRAVQDISLGDLSRRVPQPPSSDEIGQLAATMNTMLARLEDSASRQRRFAADAAHELRSPLAAVRTTLEVAIAHPDRASWPRTAERAVEQTTRLEALIDQLLLLARLDERTGPATVSLFAVRPFLASVVEECRDPSLDISIAAPPSLTMTGNETQLRRALTNVVANAVRYAERHIAIDVRLVPGPGGADRAVRLTVADDGPGIPPADRERVFDRFVRLDASRSRGTGSAGLGLAIVREIVVGHGGTVAVADSEWGGAAVTMEIPGARERPGRQDLAG